MAERQWWLDWNGQYLPDIFGPSKGGHNVKIGFHQTLEKWLPTYIAEANRQLGSRVLELPKIASERPDYRTQSRNVEAVIVCDVPHTVGTPRTSGNGSIRSNWRVDVMIYLLGTKDWAETQALTYAYGTLIRTIIIQNRGLMGVAETTQWEGDEYSEGEHLAGRTTGIVHIRFVTTLGDVGHTYDGLATSLFPATGQTTTPTTSPPADAPTVATVNATVVPKG